VVPVAEDIDVLGIEALDEGEALRVGASGNEGRIIVDGFAALDGNRLRLGVEGDNL